MHRSILKADIGQIVDHVNGDGLDNQRENLRIADSFGNARNSRGWRLRSSPFKGVYPVKGKWRSIIRINNRARHLGYFDELEDAAKAYDEAALKEFGPFARLNFHI